MLNPTEHSSSSTLCGMRRGTTLKVQKQFYKLPKSRSSTKTVHLTQLFTVTINGSNGTVQISIPFDILELELDTLMIFNTVNVSSL